MFPIHRPRRLRQSECLRRLLRETSLSRDHLVYPLFVRPGHKVRKEISSMSGIFQFSIDSLLKEVEEVSKLSIPAILLFGIPESKDEKGSSSYQKEGIVQKAVRAIKKEFPDLAVITDVCLCAYTIHGHCGVVKRQKSEDRSQKSEVSIDNDETLPLLQKMALSHAQAGADMVAPSAMMDGMVKRLREGLDGNGFEHLPIMSYSAKFASHFYGPFRDAAESPPQFGDRRGYQMDFANGQEALREVALDIEEGADIVMVKPALAYLDIIRRVKEKFSIPVAAYHVSGEYSMVKAAAQKGWLSEKEIVIEILTSSLRAGSQILITYWAKDIAGWLK
ncbi:MAG: porphobilinogen synthase [Chlamydiae bacterium]|nr:porphobilinogen synthase [Chlamydiota bacterium]MBI3266356.1 porphobilinogen synthase [Chlamydiota bacterium]